MKFTRKEFAIKNYVWGIPEGCKRPLVDVTFTPIYELIFKGFTMYFKTFKLRQEAIGFLRSGIIVPNSKFEYVEGLKVYTELIK